MGVLQAYYGHPAGCKLTSVTTAAIEKGKSDDWWRYGLFTVSVAKPFLPPFSPCAMTLPRKWRRGSGHAICKATQMLAQVKPWKLKLWRIIQFQVHTYVAILRIPTELRLIRAYLGCGYGCPRQQLQAYYCYRYRRSTAMGTGVLRLWLRAY